MKCNGWSIDQLGRGRYLRCTDEFLLSKCVSRRITLVMGATGLARLTTDMWQVGLFLLVLALACGYGVTATGASIQDKMQLLLFSLFTAAAAVVALTASYLAPNKHRIAVQCVRCCAVALLMSVGVTWCIAQYRIHHTRHVLADIFSDMMLSVDAPPNSLDPEQYPALNSPWLIRTCYQASPNQRDFDLGYCVASDCYVMRSSQPGTWIWVGFKH